MKFVKVKSPGIKRMDRCPEPAVWLPEIWSSVVYTQMTLEHTFAMLTIMRIRKVDKSYHHSCQGTIYVDNNTYLIASEALGVEMSQNLTGNLFVGNHPDDNVAIFGKGFKGVVVKMKIHGDMVNFEAEMLVGIDQYNACEYDPCETGECVIANVKFGYKCVSDSKVSAQYSDHDKGKGDESCLVEVNEKSEAVFRWTTQQLNQIMDVLVNDRLIAIYVPIHNESHLYNNNDSNLYAPLLTGSGMCQLLIKQFIRPGFKVMIRGTDIHKVEVSGKLAANCRNASSLWIYFKVNDADTSISPSVIAASILGTVVLAGAVIGVCLRQYRTATKKGMCERRKKTSRSKRLMRNGDTAV
ncbi:uncharacterized protein LOC128238873 isoform X2 [Mya arenaria]|uniref:uncharacterized protein LOC128238873 isoform X2 n=1 Tax=Mya arenaria TaxID=6604 RepID=UPI0022E07EC1|nr:uncharacterized protein LOC128238873 isoform X2 [Mya arenaria]